MPYTKSYRTIIPLEPGGDLELLRWLTRESFENTAANMGLTITEYNEREVPWLDLPPRAAEHLPLRADEYTWHEFSAVATLPQETVDWLMAESAWRKAGGK
ncbi:minor tail protein [Mycobacterium phage LilPharaoh]|uniref:Minor tail protein n=1 Tax=Mycobacterium phage Amelie TaxID=1913035 RepID=A0A1J0GPW6_9CAUD|nr:minor tail protein [Mycobacterium phage Enkosi]YP_009952540.1 minor tail protein [Mycobacterium phage Amelie]ATN90475.1 minor tail protein [Mycobacterium phage LilPharaoh]AVP42599.1 minor tail protein [Mycobacterium phage SgtBeansprout]AXC37128.1 minor tail protein [Mycobacterium phage Biglebops]QGJ93307.1 minor tail protein [Mycobacterium phage Mdavu]UQS94423.1 minor tail protein [Mycobacterium phage Nutello]UXE03184.1 minor tail protein [Mycobacterium phage Nikao]